MNILGNAVTKFYLAKLISLSRIFRIHDLNDSKALQRNNFVNFMGKKKQQQQQQQNGALNKVKCGVQRDPFILCTDEVIRAIQKICMQLLLLRHFFHQLIQ